MNLYDPAVYHCAKHNTYTFYGDTCLTCAYENKTYINPSPGPSIVDRVKVLEDRITWLEEKLGFKGEYK